MFLDIRLAIPGPDHPLKNSYFGMIPVKEEQLGDYDGISQL
jgi:hypothetical protein